MSLTLRVALSAFVFFAAQKAQQKTEEKALPAKTASGDSYTQSLKPNHPDRTLKRSPLGLLEDLLHTFNTMSSEMQPFLGSVQKIQGDSVSLPGTFTQMLSSLQRAKELMVTLEGVEPKSMREINRLVCNAEVLINKGIKCAADARKLGHDCFSNPKIPFRISGKINYEGHAEVGQEVLKALSVSVSNFRAALAELKVGADLAEKLRVRVHQKLSVDLGVTFAQNRFLFGSDQCSVLPSVFLDSVTLMQKTKYFQHRANTLDLENKLLDARNSASCTLYGDVDTHRIVYGVFCHSWSVPVPGYSGLEQMASHLDSLLPPP